MGSVSVTELKAHLSEVLRRARGGERIVVTDRGRPIAEVGPVVAMPTDEGIAELVRAGLIRLPKRRPTKKFWDEFWKLPRGDDPEASVRAALIEERESGW